MVVSEENSLHFRACEEVPTKLLIRVSAEAAETAIEAVAEESEVGFTLLHSKEALLEVALIRASEETAETAIEAAAEVAEVGFTSLHSVEALLEVALTVFALESLS